MAGITPDSASTHRSAVVHDPGDPELIAGRSVAGDALFSPCRRWRYRLSRRWESGQGRILWIMLNPSTADAVRVDPTVRRAITWSIAWGFTEAWVGNVFALRATSPSHLYRDADPIGPDNDDHLTAMASTADRIVLAWGNHAAHGGRARSVASLLHPWADRCVHLAETGAGMPGHPLYLPGDALPRPAADLMARLVAATPDAPGDPPASRTRRRSARGTA